MRTCAFTLLALTMTACGGKTVDAVTTDACTACVPDSEVIDSPPARDTSIAPDVTPAFDDGPPPFPDVASPPADCFTARDKEEPPIACGPDGSTPACSSIAAVATCPTDSDCMARVTDIGPIADFRLGRLRLYAPDALLSLSSLAIDPNMNPVCVDHGSETFDWMMRFDATTKTITTGGANPSLDGGTTYALTHAVVDSSAVDAICPGFVGPTTPVSLAPATIPFSVDADGAYTSGTIPKLNLPIFDGSVPIVLPLSQLTIRHASVSPDGRCIGRWSRGYWCDGDSLGWTTGGAVVAKILIEDADHVPVKAAGCQSLCAVLANDASKISGRVCKRGTDGKILATGDSTVTTTNDAFLFSATFAAYAVKIVP